MLSVSNVSMRYGAKILFDEVSVAFTPGKRYGLTGPNGAGKSTFMELQGGQKVRVLLAQALFGHPQALLLDEPTNNLDLDSIHWLQGFLNAYDGVVIAISHDRHFLNSICTHIADIDYETIITYTGLYDEMVLAKTQVRSQIESQNAQREKKISQLNEFIARFSAGTRSSQVQSRRKEVERLQVTELARSNIQRPFIKFEMKRPSGKHVLELEGVSKSYGDSKIVQDFTASVLRGEKIALMGRNGVGKTTLINALLANSPTTPEAELRKTSGYEGAFVDSGKGLWGHEASIGYFAQAHRSRIEGGITALDGPHQGNPAPVRKKVRG